MILNFDDFFINEKHSIKKVKKLLRGVLNSADRDTMRKELRHNIIVFKFIKRDGSLRKAKGTLHPSYLPPLKGGSPKPEHQMVYYDLDKKHWRSFRSFKFIKIIDIIPIDSSKTSDPTKHKHSTSTSTPKHSSKTLKDDEDVKTTKSEDIKKSEHTKEYKKGDKIPEEELIRRSADFRKDSRKNKYTHKANDEFKKEKNKDITDEESSK